MITIKHYSQRDPKWSTKLLGFDNSTTIGAAGCLLTSMAMVCSYYGFSETPDTLNDKMKAVQGFQGPLIMPYLVAQALPGMVYANYIQSMNQPAPLSEIDATLAQNQPVIVEVDFSPSQGLQNHWIVLVSKQGSDYIIADPWPVPVDSKPVTLASRFGFGQPASQIIKAALWLNGSPAAPATPPASPNLDTSVVASFKVYATVDGLAIRSQTLVSDATLIERVPLNTSFSVLEADALARPLIGQVNQWLPVKAADGTVGYVAAWYVSLTSQTPPAAVPSSAPANQPTPVLVVNTTSAGVALRSAPLVSDATLIKYMPLGAQLKVMEDDSVAQTKIGVLNQWLQVQDISGKVGLVAGSCVALSTGQAALGTIPKTTPDPVSVLLRVTQDGLAFRSAPIIADNTLIKHLALGAELIAIEAQETVLAKIGQVGDWIQVRDVTGAQGYVAAWYVIQRPVDPLPPPDAPIS